MFFYLICKINKSKTVIILYGFWYRRKYFKKNIHLKTTKENSFNSKTVMYL